MKKTHLKKAIHGTVLALMGSTMLCCTSATPKKVNETKEPLSYSEAVAKADSLVKLMTPEEKILMIGGTEYFYTQAIARLGIPKIKMTDATGGVHLRAEFMGVNYKNAIDSTTSFPAPILLASTWNRQMAHDYAQSIGEECRAAGIPVLLGPGMNIYRVSQCGRNFEYFGEDPFLASQMVASYVKGVQSTGVIATLKHFVANNTDFFRRKSNSIVDERAIHEIYTPAFKAGIDAGARAVMTSYNLVNGEWCGQSEYIISQLLRKELGFNWLVMTDWWSVYDGEKVIRSGQGIEMPSAEATANAKTLLDESKVTMAQIDNMVRQQLAAFISMGSFDMKPDSSYVAKYPIHEQKALQTAREGMVMLKNNGILPIASNTTGILATGYYFDELLQGGGSAYVKGYSQQTFRMAMNKEFGDRITFNESATDEEIKNAPVVILNIGTVDSEGYDRPFELPAEMEARVKKITSLNANTIVVINSGSGIRMTSWNDKANAIIYSWYPGQNGFIALAEILTGKTNPSGKLPMTIEKDLKDAPAFGYMKGEPFYTGWNDDGEKAHPVYDVEYKESILVGYRWYDTKKVEPLYPFGHGLSYTCFDYSDLTITPVTNGESGEFEVTMNVKNIGSVDGAEIVQLYVQDTESSVLRPEKELKGFDKLMIKAGETANIKFNLTRKDFSFYDTTSKQWVAESGAFNILVGRSSRDIRVKSEVILE
jgi:beta-glucosidase